jgi:hypothetical protein
MRRVSVRLPGSMAARPQQQQQQQQPHAQQQEQLEAGAAGAGGAAAQARKRGSAAAPAAGDAAARLKRSKSEKLLGEDGADAGLGGPLSPMPSAAGRGSSGGGAAGLSEPPGRGKPSFADLVAARVLAPGVYDFSVGTAQCVTAEVTPSGTIVLAGVEHGSISSFALAAARSRNPTRQACDGWREVRLGGRRLEAWRRALVEGTAPPEAVPRAGPC